MLIRVLAENWVLKSERVLISEGIEATAMYIAIYAHACTCVCTYSIQYMYNSHVATRLKKEDDVELELC